MLNDVDLFFHKETDQKWSAKYKNVLEWDPLPGRTHRQNNSMLGL